MTDSDMTGTERRGIPGDETDLDSGMLDLSDDELVENTRAGSIEAFEELWQRHSVFGLVAATAEAGDQGERVSRDAWISILKEIRENPEPRGAIRADLYSCIREATAQDQPLPDDDSIAMAEAFSTLPARWQEILWYADVEKMSVDDVTFLTNLPPADITTTKTRARRGLTSAWLQVNASYAEPDSTCVWVRQHARAYMKKTLPQNDTGILEQHLATCRDCRLVLATARNMGAQAPKLLLNGVAGALAAPALLEYWAANGPIVINEDPLPNAVAAAFLAEAGPAPAAPPARVVTGAVAGGAVAGAAAGAALTAGTYGAGGVGSRTGAGGTAAAGAGAAGATTAPGEARTGRPGAAAGVAAGAAIGAGVAAGAAAAAARRNAAAAGGGAGTGAAGSGAGVGGAGVGGANAAGGAGAGVAAGAGAVGAAAGTVAATQLGGTGMAGAAGAAGSAGTGAGAGGAGSAAGGATAGFGAAAAGSAGAGASGSTLPSSATYAEQEHARRRRSAFWLALLILLALIAAIIAIALATHNSGTPAATATPTVSATPTESATPSPTVSASETPTAEPTPSEEPTEEPTPSETPSEEPTEEPTPSETPAEQPTTQPAVAPVVQPPANTNPVASIRTVDSGPSGAFFPTITGMAQPGDMITVLVGNLAYTATTDARGNWSVGPLTGLGAGSYTVTAQAALNPAPVTTSFTIASPPTPSVSKSASGVTLSLSGTPNSMVQVLVDQSPRSFKLDGSGTYSGTLDLSSGSHTITTRYYDAGRYGPSSAPVTVTV